MATKEGETHLSIIEQAGVGFLLSNEGEVRESLYFFFFFLKLIFSSLCDSKHCYKNKAIYIQVFTQKTKVSTRLPSIFSIFLSISSMNLFPILHIFIRNQNSESVLISVLF